MIEILQQTKKHRLVKESKTRYIVEEYVWFWIIWYWQRAEITLDWLWKWYYSYNSLEEAKELFNKEFR